MQRRAGLQRAWPPACAHLGAARTYARAHAHIPRPPSPQAWQALCLGLLPKPTVPGRPAPPAAQAAAPAHNGNGNGSDHGHGALNREWLLKDTPEGVLDLLRDTQHAAGGSAAAPAEGKGEKKARPGGDAPQKGRPIEGGEGGPGSQSWGCLRGGGLAMQF